MFKNCCGCQSKKTNRKESEDDEDEEEEEEETKEKENDNQINNAIEKTNEATAGVIAQKENVVEEKREECKITEEKKASPEQEPLPEIVQRKTSLKKPKPRLSISTEVKIIPSNFPEDLEDVPGDEEEPPPEETTKKEEEEEDEPPEEIKITIKNIDGKVIKKSLTDESPGKLSPPASDAERPTSPLSDEVFVTSEQGGLELPLHNLGVKVDVIEKQALACGLDIPLSPRGQAPTPHPVKRSSMPAVLPRWLSEDDEDEKGGTHEPPATPVARDELALRRHRFFSELLSAAQAATEHRVRFDPFGPTIERLSELEQGPTVNQAKEFENLLNRLENITSRLEKAVPILEKNLEPYQNSIVVTKSLEDLLDEHLTPTEKENLNILIQSQSCGNNNNSSNINNHIERENEKNENAISPDSSADFEELSEKDLTLNDNERISNGIDKILNSASDRSENSSNSQNTVVNKEILEKVDEPECNIKKSDEVEVNSKSENHIDKLNNSEVIVGDESIKLNGSVDLKEEMTNSQSTLSMSVQGYQDILQGPFASYLEISARIGGDVAEHAKLVQQAFQAQLQYLSIASTSSKPNQSDDMRLLQPTSQYIQAIQDYREKHRASQYFNHLSAISESIPALGWVTISPAPAPYVKEMNDAGQFYTNRVLKDWKEKDKVHVDWTKAWVQTLTELQSFVKQFHTTGIVWSGTSAPRVTGVPPPPPPCGMPPPPPVLDLADIAPADSGQDRSALFAEINQGENITRSLKKVTSDMQTHKNPGLRSGPAPFKAPPASITNQTPKPFKAASPPEKPPKFNRDGKKWLIEYQKGNHQLVVENAEMNNVVYVYKCTDSTLVVKGKVNSIFLDSCKKTAVVFDSVVSSIEFVNCQSVQMQVLGKVPTISIDKTDGCQMYLSQDSLGVEVISSKSSEMNILVPAGNGDFSEHPVPEQFKTTVSSKGLTTIAVENKG